MQNVNIKSQQETKEVLHRGLHFQKAGNAGPDDPDGFSGNVTPHGGLSLSLAET